MPVWIWLLVAVWLYRFIFCLSGYLRIKYYRHRYYDFIEKGKFDFAIYTHPLTNLFKRAGVSDIRIPLCEPIGYGQIMTGSTNLWGNMSNRYEENVAGMLHCFSQAEGAYRAKILECFSPLYWIECVIFLPSKILDYIGIKADSIFPKLIQLLYWIGAPLLLLFRTELYEHIAALLDKLS